MPPFPETRRPSSRGARFYPKFRQPSGAIRSRKGDISETHRLPRIFVKFWENPGHGRWRRGKLRYCLAGREAAIWELFNSFNTIYISLVSVLNLRESFTIFVKTPYILNYLGIA